MTIFSIVGGRGLSWLIFNYSRLIILTKILKFLVLFICFMGGALRYFIVFNLKRRGILIYFNRLIWFLPILRSFNINKIFLLVGMFYYKRVDFGWNELLGGGLVNYLLKLNYYYMNLNSNWLFYLGGFIFSLYLCI